MKPFVHMIGTPWGKYVYDVNMHTVLSISESTYKKLCQEEVQIDLCEKDCDEIRNLFNHGFLRENIITEIKHPFTDYIESYLNWNMNNITLQVTQACNFYCRYCPFSGNGILDRTHGNHQMTWQTAKTALDFFIKHSIFSQTLSISFYGGEPLLNYGLIVKCVDYMKRIEKDKKINYYITTNVSLLDKEKIDFLKSNDFNILASFDGPEYVQNKNRKFAMNGKGTFKRVYDNLKYIVENYREYVAKIELNAVIDPEIFDDTIYDFFNNDPIISKFERQFTNLDQSHVELSYYIDDKTRMEKRYERLSYLFYLGKGIEKEAVNNILTSSFDLVQENIKNKFVLSSSFHPRGQCAIGYKKMFIDIDGNIWPCEKVSAESKHLCIGNVKTGIDIKKIENLLNIGKLNSEACKNCWCIRFCDICIVSIDNTHCLSENVKKDICAATRREYSEQLMELIVVEEIKKMYIT